MTALQLPDEQPDPLSSARTHALSFAGWKAQLIRIAEQAGYRLKPVQWPGSMDVWVKHYNAGRTPQEAWDAEPGSR